MFRLAVFLLNNSLFFDICSVVAAFPAHCLHFFLRMQALPNVRELLLFLWIAGIGV